MYFYEIGYGSHEESDVVYLMHKRAFKQHQFNKAILECSIAAAEARYDSIGESYDEYSKEEPGKWDRDTICITYADIYQDVADLLCERYGFQRVPVRYRFWAWGWSDLRSIYKEKHGGRLQRKIARAVVSKLGYSVDWVTKSLRRRKTREKYAGVA